MHSTRVFALLRLGIAEALALACFAAAAARAEENVWPFRVAETDAEGAVVSWQAAGPLAFSKPSAEPGTVSGLRPLFAQWRRPNGTVRETDLLYPLFVYRADSEAYRWSVFQLINRTSRLEPGVAAERYDGFDVWPLWFSRRTGDPESSYQALFPVGGRIRHRFGYDQLSFVVFPLFGQARKRGTITTAAPWPIIRTTRGAETGFAVWPLFGWREKPGAFEHRYWLWPLGWHNVDQPEPEAAAGTAPRRQVGFLPFYSRESAPGYTNAAFLWPFFGYTDRTQPVRYHETRYFWPFVVHGEGQDQSVARWAPLYTHSVRKGAEKTWIVWPLYREKRFLNGGVVESQRQFLYVLYRSTEQRSAANPRAEPAEKMHVWPLFSSWNNGAGRVQFQFPSPLEVFFPDNERIRVSWSPLFSLYRYDQRSPGEVRQEWLWGLVTSRRAEAEREFHLGPLFSRHERDGGKRIALGHGLVAWQRGAPGTPWRIQWFDFAAKADKLTAASR